jgi:hypothetical protein
VREIIDRHHCSSKRRVHSLCGGDEGLNLLAQSDKQLITISAQSIFHLRSMKEGNCGDAMPFYTKQLAVTATDQKNGRVASAAGGRT